MSDRVIVTNEWSFRAPEIDIKGEEEQWRDVSCTAVLVERFEYRGRHQWLWVIERAARTALHGTGIGAGANEATASVRLCPNMYLDLLTEQRDRYGVSMSAGMSPILDVGGGVTFVFDASLDDGEWVMVVDRVASPPFAVPPGSGQ